MGFNNQARLSRVLFLCLMFIWKVTAADLPDGLVNVAFRKPAWMSDADFVHGLASWVNDGDNSTHWDLCAMSLIDNAKLDRKFWRVDLLGIHQVYYVVVTTVGNGYPYILGDFEIRMAIDMDQPWIESNETDKLCAYQRYGLGPGTSKTLRCKNGPLEARIVSLLFPARNVSDDEETRKKNRKPLILCEVEVFAKQTELLPRPPYDYDTPDDYYFWSGLECKADFYFRCAEGFFCDGDGNCSCLVAESCKLYKSYPKRCGSGTHCVDGYCTYKIHAQCDVQPEWCKGNLFCDPTAHCAVKLGGNATDPTDCGLGSVLVDNKCACPEGVTAQKGVCPLRAELVHGSCSGSCKDPNAECKDGICVCKEGYAADNTTFTCALGPGKKCKDDSECPAHTVCDFREECRLKVGHNCRAGSFRCSRRLICDWDHTCRINAQDYCNATTAQHCRADTVCDFAGHCRIDFYQTCDPDIENPCAITYSCWEERRLCYCRGTKQFPRPKRGPCGYINIGDTCSPNTIRHTDCERSMYCDPVTLTCQCLPGYVQHSGHHCAGTAGMECNKDKICHYDLVCTNGTCHNWLGRNCTQELKEYCISVSVCDIDNTCKLPIRTPCDSMGLSKLCVRYATCDYFSGKCKWQVGANCSKQPDQCAGLAECKDGVCACPHPNQHGTQCLSEIGELYGPCAGDQQTCGNPDMVECKDGMCVCKTKSEDCKAVPVTPEDGGEGGGGDDGGGNETDQPSIGDVPGYAIALSVTAALLVLLAIAFFVWKMRRMNFDFENESYCGRSQLGITRTRISSFDEKKGEQAVGKLTPSVIEEAEEISNVKEPATPEVKPQPSLDPSNQPM